MRTAWWIVVVLAACRNETQPPPPPEMSTPPEDPRHPTRGDIPLASFPLLPYGAELGRYDATPPAAIRQHFAGARARSCGLLALDAKPADHDASAACVEQALAAKHPFAFVEEVQGTDSGVLYGFVGVMEVGAFVTYELHYDSNPCGGGCPEAGHTGLARCATLHLASACHGDDARCYECQGGEGVDAWIAGAKTGVPTGVAEQAVTRVFGAAPASLGPAFEGVALGASTPATVAALARARAELEAGGIIAVGKGNDRIDDVSRTDAIEIRFAGRCGAIRERLVAAWGPSKDDTWQDPRSSQRASLQLAECRVRIERYAPVEAWIGADRGAAIWPVVPIAAYGLPRSALKAKLVAAGHAVRDEDDQLRWIDLGVGRDGVPTTLDALYEHGHMTALEASVETDAATIELVRARVTALRGAPTTDESYNDNTVRSQHWRGTPSISLDTERGKVSLAIDSRP